MPTLGPGRWWIPETWRFPQPTRCCKVWWWGAVSRGSSCVGMTTPEDQLMWSVCRLITILGWTVNVWTKFAFSSYLKRSKRASYKRFVAFRSTPTWRCHCGTFVLWANRLRIGPLVWQVLCKKEFLFSWQDSQAIKSWHKQHLTDATITWTRSDLSLSIIQFHKWVMFLMYLTKSLLVLCLQLF